MRAMIELIDAGKRFGDTWALHPTDLGIEQGQTTVLIGPSGCGKSTILRLIMGLVQPTQGRILFEGTEVNGENVIAVRRRIGYVVQDGGLFPHLTARQNIVLMAQHLRRPNAEIDVRLEEIRTLTRFPSEALDRYPLELSGGQKQRVSLMRALMLQPEALLLDEPLGALDPMVRADLQGELRDIFRTLGQTVLMVTHDMGEAAFLGDVIILLREGKIVQSGSLADFQSNPSEPFVTSFLNAQRSLVAL